MKKIILLLVLGTFFCFDVTAKYVYPEGSTTTTERRVNRRMKRYDTDSNEELSLKEYENYREPRTRDERRMKVGEIYRTQFFPLRQFPLPCSAHILQLDQARLKVHP